MNELDGTTQDEGELANEGEESAPELSERDRKMRELVKDFNKHEGREVEEPEDADEDDSAGEGEDDGEALKDEILEDNPAQEEGQDPSPDVPDDIAALGYYRNTDGELARKLKINGVVREILAGQEAAHIQKDLAGDEKLRYAAEMERKLKQERADIERLTAQRGEQLGQTFEPPEQGASIESLASDLVDETFDGDPAKVKEQLVQLFTRLEPTLTNEQIQQQVTAELNSYEANRAAQAAQVSIDRGKARLAKEFPSVLKDDDLFVLVDRETERMLAKQQAQDPDFINLTPEDIILKSARNVTDRQDKRAGKTSSRASNKAGLKPMPTRRPGLANRKPEAVVVDNSPAAVIERMKQGRAQGVSV